MNSHQTLNQLWKSLDHLAQTDPKRYKDYLSSIQHQHIWSDRTIQPNFHLIYPASENSLYLVNICKSIALKPPNPNDPLNIETLISEKRLLPNEYKKYYENKDDTWNNLSSNSNNASNSEDDSKNIYIIDVVFHPKIHLRADLDTSIIDLALSCIDQLFNVKLNRKIEKQKPGYFGEYGWNDSAGKPLLQHEWIEIIEKENDPKSKLKEVQKVLKDGLLNEFEFKGNVLTKDLTEIDNQPEESRVNIVGLTSSEETLHQERKPLIEVIGDDVKPVDDKSTAVRNLGHVKAAKPNSPVKPKIHFSKHLFDPETDSETKNELEIDETENILKLATKSSSPKGSKLIEEVLTTPAHTSKTDDESGRHDLRITLPGIKSSSQITFKVQGLPKEKEKDGQFMVVVVEAEPYSLRYVLPEGFRVVRTEFKYIKTKETLKMSFYTPTTQL